LVIDSTIQPLNHSTIQPITIKPLNHSTSRRSMLIVEEGMKDTPPL